MAEEFKFQDPGEGIHEAEIHEIRVSEGDSVEEGEILLDAETDKATFELPASFTGTIEQIKVQEGDRAQVGDVLMTYRAKGEQAQTEEKAQPEEEKKTPPAEEISEKKQPKPEQPPKPEKGPVPASPATRRLARELGVNLREVSGSGPGGRVESEDVRAYAEQKKKAPKEERPPQRAGRFPPEVPPLPDFSQWGTVKTLPFRGIRRRTAERMALAWSQIPHVTHEDVADITELEDFRRQQKATVEAQGGRLSLTVLVMKAAVSALKKFPHFNASLDVESEEIILKEYYHLGIAVDSEQGLIVPVIRDVDRKSLIDLAIELPQLVEQVQSGNIKPEMMRGGTFTITNPAPIGGTRFAPIVNYPQVAILGMGRARLEPVIQGDREDFTVVPRLRLPLIVAFDHRINDGADTARFARAIVDILADPEAFLLTV